MSLEAKALGHTGVAGAIPLSFRRSISSFPPRLLFRSAFPPQVHRPFQTLAVVKRSPKRLKYSSPRFTKKDGLLYVQVDQLGSDSWKLDPVAELLKEGAVGVIPTDTPLSIICRSFHDIDTYTTGFPRGNSQGLTDIFRAVKHCLPGPYTFILAASKQLPKQCTRYGTATSKYASRKNVGVRIPDDSVCQAILEKLDRPLISTSVKSPKENEWILDPVIIADVYGPEGLDFVVDAGVRVAYPSTVVDMTESAPRIIRQGKGPKQPWMIAEDDDSALDD
ncbi:putative ribonucleoside-diphosphate reductase small chain-like [Capsicum annuum]|nr:putative ribonucleoside-diphosphate reductase small chain-like [Capsicum annuum]